MYGVWQVTRPFVCEVWSTNFVIVVRFAKLSWLPRIIPGSVSKSMIWHSSQPFVWVFEKVMWARGKKLNTNFLGPLERFALFFKRTASIPNSGSERPVGILEMLLNYWTKRSSVLVKWSWPHEKTEISVTEMSRKFHQISVTNGLVNRLVFVTPTPKSLLCHGQSKLRKTDSVKEQSEFETITCNPSEAWQIACGNVTIWFGLVSRWVRKKQIVLLPIREISYLQHNLKLL